MDKRLYVELPPFTGRNVPITEIAKAIWNSRKPEHEDTCSMCGKFCAVRSMNKALAGEYIDIL